MTIHNNKVSVVSDDSVNDYPKNPPYHPPKLYPEYPLSTETDGTNKIYGMVRILLYQLDLDKENFGSKSWNPFKGIIKEGNTVVIKPNLVKHVHPLGDEGVRSMITHGSVLRPIVDYAYIALKGKGKIIICDTPLEKADFEEIMRLTGIKDFTGYLKDKHGYPIEVFDLRKYRSYPLPGDKWKYDSLKGDSDGYVQVNLGKESEFSELNTELQNYHTLADHNVKHHKPFTKDIGKTNEYHNSNKHEYMVAKTILNADAIICVPKLKTHGKAGVTLNLKNMIGIVPDKIYMPHHRPGMPPYGDAFPVPPEKSYIRKRSLRIFISGVISKLIGYRITEMLKNSWVIKCYDKLFSTDDNHKPIEWGGWYGNDTLWRTILDLNKIAIYCDAEGNLRKEPQIRYFSIVDGIIGEEGDGPMAGDPINASVLIGGFNPVTVDTISAVIMGFDPNKIKSIYKAAHINRYLGDCDCSNIEVICNTEKLPSYKFNAPPGWKSFIESDCNGDRTIAQTK